MSSGDSIAFLNALAWQPTGTTAATFNIRSLSAFNLPVLEFTNGASVVSAVAIMYIPRYVSSAPAVTVNVSWMPDASTSAACVFYISMCGINPGVDDITGKSFGALQTLTSSAPSTLGLIKTSSIAITNVNTACVSAGAFAGILIQRDPTNAADLLAQCVQLVSVEVIET